ncbi:MULTISPECIES: hypothetical protein [Enterobacteriaceae]|uniref:hypothetical protein n=1 Tax=Enterobacteriaceae TaxID=543 RepID=UPI0003A6AB8D|nr:hypothetical protein [Salmonella enterica]EIN8656047.1 hypothetical protein [Citrobacter freundii]MBJ9836124.1 hypothetical protein [Citrobacter freundii]DAM69453.1 MAG TPA: Geopilin domain 1 protein, PilA, bacterial nanowire, type [Caudoviricetes sp.]
MKLEMAIGLFIFAVLVLSLIQFLIRVHGKKIKQKKEKALSEFRARREEVERKARRQL